MDQLRPEGTAGPCIRTPEAIGVQSRNLCSLYGSYTPNREQVRREAQDLKEVVAEQALELRLLKKSMIGDGGDQT